MMYRHLGRLIGRHLPVRGTDRLLRRLDDPDAGVDHPFLEPFYGFRYPGNLRRFIDWSVYYYGAYSRYELNLLGALARSLERSLGRAPVAWDVGANIGHHTLFLAGCCRRVIAFEPLPEHIALIEEKVRINGIDCVTIEPIALGDADGEVDIHHPDPAAVNGGTASIHADYDRQNACRSRVPLRRGDTVLREFGLPPPELVKIDVEGHEPAVLAGMAEIIADAAPLLFIETSDYAVKSVARYGGLATLLGDAEFYVVSVNRWSGDYRLTPYDGDGGYGDALLAVPAARRQSIRGGEFGTRLP